MLELPLSEDGIRWAKKERSRRDASGLTDYFRRKGRDQRWTGLAAEYEFYQWARDQGLPIRWNGGVDDKADFVIGNGGESWRNLRLAMKINNGPGSRDDFTFIVNVKHPGQLADGVLLGIVSTPQKKLWIAGYISADRFRLLAEKKKKGDPGFVKGRTVEYDCYTIRADQLESAEMFFELIRRAK